MSKLLFLVLFGLVGLSLSQQYRPLVLLHGLLASAEAMSHIQGWVAQDFPGMYTKNIEIGNGRDDSLFMDLNDQCASLAQQILADPKLAKGFTLIGHSQGALTSRCAIERYNLPVYNFISLAGPMDGVYGVPDFNALCPDNLCPWLDDIMSQIVEGSWIEPIFQSHISFAAYWKDPLHYDDYLKYSIYLPDVNNEGAVKNATYKANLLKLNQMLLIYSTHDDIVIPEQSPWFYFFSVGSDSLVLPLQNSTQWTEDWLGLRALYESNRLSLKSVPCDHQDIPTDSCKQYYISEYRDLINTTLPSF
jgi:palmitoyl-protein thioesterase